MKSGSMATIKIILNKYRKLSYANMMYYGVYILVGTVSVNLTKIVICHRKVHANVCI